MEDRHIAWYARIESIKAEIEAAKVALANNADSVLNASKVYNSEWFFEKARELQGIADETYKF